MGRFNYRIVTLVDDSKYFIIMYTIYMNKYIYETVLIIILN